MTFRKRSTSNISKLFFVFFILAGSVRLALAQNQIDPTFNAVPSMPPSVKGQIIQPDGKIVIWGDALTVDGVAKGQVARLNADGSLDTSFSYCGCHLPSLRGVLGRADGKLMLAGQGPSFEPKVVRLNTDGSADGGFNTSYPLGNEFDAGYVDIYAIQSDGKALVRETHINSVGTGRSFYRLNADGSRDASYAGVSLGFGRTTGSDVTSAAIMPDGKLMLGISSFSTQFFAGSLHRYNTDGTADSTWELPSFTMGGGQNSTSVDSVDLQTDGSVVVGGHFDGVNGLTKFEFVRFLTAGNVDTTFNSTGIAAGTGNQTQVLPSGKILVKASIGLGSTYKIYRLNSDGSMDGTFVFDPAISTVLKNWSLDASGRIVFYGRPSSAGADRLYRLNVNGDIDAGFNPNIGKMGQINASAMQPDGKLLVAGNFIQMNGIAKRSLARLNTDGSLDASFDAGSGLSAVPEAIRLQPDGKILAVGDFGSYNGAPRTGLVRINADGSIDAAFNPIFSSRPVDAVLQPDGKIIAIGLSSTVNGVSRTGVVRLNSDGTLDTGFAPIVGGSPDIRSVGLQADGKIVFSGIFSGVNGFSRTNLARLNSDGSLDASFNAGSAGSSSNMNILPDGKILLSGRVRRNADGSLDPSYVSPTIANGSDPSSIDTVLVQSDGSVIVGGLFTTVNSIGHNNIVRLSSTGAPDPLFFPNGSDGEIRTLAAGTGGKVFIGGDFTKFDNSIRAGIVRVNTAAFHKPAFFDFDGDGRADISVTRSAGVDTWYQLLGSSHTFNQISFGQTGDIVTPADYDGDGKTDAAIFRPSNGQWWYLSSIDGSQKASTWGASGDIPLPSDFNGDGKTDFVTWRPSTGEWERLANGSTTASNILFGAPGDKPLIGDFDGDGKSDPAVYRPSTGQWWYAASNQGNAFRAFQWGNATDIPAAADYDGDGKTDFAIYRPSSGTWWIYNSSTGNYNVVTWGIAEDRPIPADYDGDGKADVAVFRPSNGTWYLLTSSSGFSGFQWGISTDVPSPGAFVP